MKQEVCLLPVRCQGCGTMFDLWYDLQQDGAEVNDENNEFKRIASQHFCWQCRQSVLNISGNNKKMVGNQTMMI